MFRVCTSVYLLLVLVDLGLGAIRGNSMDQSTGNNWKDVGQFPFARGETPVFHFDNGDEGFINTIPGLIQGLDKIRSVVGQQTKITKAFGEAFDQCEACG